MFSGCLAGSKSSKSGVACFGAQAEGKDCADCIPGFCRGGGPSLEVRDRLKMLKMPFCVRGLERVAVDGYSETEPGHGL